MNTAFGHLELLNTTVTAWQWLLGSDSTMAVHPTSLPSGDPATFRMKLGYSWSSPAAGIQRHSNQLSMLMGMPLGAYEHLAVTIATSLRCKSPECCLISTVLHMPALNLLSDFSVGGGGDPPTSQGNWQNYLRHHALLCSICQPSFTDQGTFHLQPHTRELWAVGSPLATDPPRQSKCLWGGFYCPD